MTEILVLIKGQAFPDLPITLPSDADEIFGIQGSAEMPLRCEAARRYQEIQVSLLKVLDKAACEGTNLGSDARRLARHPQQRFVQKHVGHVIGRQDADVAA